MKKDKKHYTVTELAESGVLPVCDRTIRRMIAAGRIKAENIGAGDQPRWIITAAEVKRLKNRRKP